MKFRKPPPLHPARPEPFTVGRLYRSARHFEKWGVIFQAGELLRFVIARYEYQSDATAFEFTAPDGSYTKRWWLHDEEPLESWQLLFEPVAEDHSPKQDPQAHR